MNAFTLSLLLLAPAPALAFHEAWDRSGYGDVAPSPGPGGIYYTGSPHDHGLTCAACHVDAPGRIRATTTFTPALSGGRYRPGQRYRVDVAISGSGCTVPGLSGLMVFMGDATGRRSVGAYHGGTPDPHPGSRGDHMFVLDRDPPWAFSFDWTAPAVGTGEVRFFGGVTVGDCVSRPPSDYADDDNVMIEMRLGEGSSSMLDRRPSFRLARSFGPALAPRRRGRHGVPS